MPKYLVTLEENVRYTMEVEAKDEDEAEVVAEERFLQSEAPWDEFVTECVDRYPFMVTEERNGD